MSSFEHDNNNTDDWGFKCETPDFLVPVHKDTLEALKEDSNILYALRKMGFVTAGQEDAAVEFLEEEGFDV